MGPACDSEDTLDSKEAHGSAKDRKADRHVVGTMVRVTMVMVVMVVTPVPMFVCDFCSAVTVMFHSVRKEVQENVPEKTACGECKHDVQEPVGKIIPEEQEDYGISADRDE